MATQDNQWGSVTNRTLTNVTLVDYHFSSFGQYSVARAEIPVAEVGAMGGTAAPLLRVPVKLNVWHGHLAPDEGMQLVSLCGKLQVGHEILSRSYLVDLRLTLVPRYPKHDESCYLEFPLDASRIAALERARNGGDLRVRVSVQLVADQRFALRQPPPNNPLGTIVWGHAQRYFMDLDAEITIPRDVWISRVLPQIGNGLVYLVELLAVSIEACERLKHSYDALKQAQERHRIGQYDDAVGKCRVALDPFFESVEETNEKGEKRLVPRLKKSWQTMLAQATYDWLADAVNSIKYAGNPAHHSPNPHYDQLESQMIIMITTALVAYAARVEPKS